MHCGMKKALHMKENGHAKNHRPYICYPRRGHASAGRAAGGYRRSFKYGGWVVPHFDERLGVIMHEQMTKPRDLLLGRKTYEIFASYWPTHESDVAGHQFRDEVCCFGHSYRSALGQHDLYPRTVVEEIRN
jgi:hypothetical protein